MLTRDWPFVAAVVWTLAWAGFLVYLIFFVR
jgi:hypothetical protein